jgi:predicted dinucleotide-binding enzyme
MRIGIIGTGKVGSALAEHWVRAGHEVVLSSRHPERLRDFALRLGDLAATGSAHQAAMSAQVVLLAIPLKGVKELSEAVRTPLRGKVILNACNPIEERDGATATEVIQSAEGTGLWSTSFFPGSRMVRAFNSVPAENLWNDAHRRRDPIGVPIASDDEGALEIASLLIRDAGFEPIVAGGLLQGRAFEPGTALWGRAIPSSRLYELLASRKAA